MKLRLTFLLLLVTVTGFSQKKEKIKGNKVIKVKQHQIAPFTTLDLNENLEVYLLEGATPQIEIKADENVHKVFNFNVDKNGILTIRTTHRIVNKKTLKIRITFTEEFNSIVASNKAKINSLMDFEMNTLNITARDNAKIRITAKAKDFKLETFNQAKVELNLISANATVLLNESSNLKALINANNLKLDLYQKANAKIEGDAYQLDLKVDNSTNFKGEKFSAKNCNLIAEGSSDCYLDIKDILTLEASGSSKVYIFGSPKIELNKFGGSAILYKK